MDPTENRNEHLQNDEIYALSSIYGEEWMLEDLNGKVYSINIIGSSGKSVYFQVILLKTYPLQSPPRFRISAPWMDRDAKNRLISALNQTYLENIGESIIYQWTIQIKEFINEPDLQQTQENPEDMDKKLDSYSLVLNENILSDQVLAQFQEKNMSFNDEIPLIQHGESIVDRKSVFQAHIAKVVSEKQVKQVLQKLKENRKIFLATHNVFAYRIALENKAFIQDCDDDGESRAGSVLLHLLQILDVSDILVVVTRWYGGIQLGADRFKHYSNAARNVLNNNGLITKKNNNASKKKIKITS